MATLNFNKIGQFSVHDSGAPPSEDYTTLVLLHGFAWHSGIFSRIVPFAGRNNARIVLINRRGYPGSTPISDDEVEKVKSATELSVLQEHVKGHAKDLYEFLETFISTEKISQKGGVVVAGWSFGSVFVTSFLKYAPTFPVGTVDVASYIRYAVTYDPPYHSLGYPPPEESYNPLFHPSHPPGEGVKIFPAWVSGYYIHGNSPSKLEHRKALETPPPTITTMSEADLGSALYPAPAIPGGSDDVLLNNGIKLGLYQYLRESVLFSEPGQEGKWSRIKLRYIWCDRSVWEMPWGTWALEAELDKAKKEGKGGRTVQIVRLSQANHFFHWDKPEHVLQALVGDDVDETSPSEATLPSQ